MKTLPLLLGTALTLCAGAAGAHRPWLLPSTTVVSGTDDWVTVDAAISNDLFYADHFPMPLEQIAVSAPDGSVGKIENGAKGRYRSTFDVHLDRPGTWRIGTVNASVSGTFKRGGEDWTVGRRRGPPPAPGSKPDPHAVATVADIPADATDLQLTESDSRTDIFVTAGAPTRTVLATTGKGLEIDPITHPDELVSNEVAKFRFLIDGRPAANVKVTLVPGGKRYRDGEDAQELTTGADGVLAIIWPAPGMFWLNAIASDTHPTLPRATARRMSYVATLEVLAP